jgi:hypothetical protein
VDIDLQDAVAVQKRIPLIDEHVQAEGVDHDVEAIKLLHAFPLAAVARLRGFSESFPEYGAP